MFFLYNIEECFALPINIYKRVRSESVSNQHNSMNNETNSESFGSKASAAAFKAVDTMADVGAGTVSFVGGLALQALKATTYFIIGGAIIAGSVVAFSPKPAGTERERLENLIIIDQREVMKKDSTIKKLESEGTVSRAVRKLRGKPLE